MAKLAYHSFYVQLRCPIKKSDRFSYALFFDVPALREVAVIGITAQKNLKPHTKLRADFIK